MKSHAFHSIQERILGGILITCLLLVTLPILTAHAATNRYVDKTGTDSGTCLSSSPCLTITYAMSQSDDGDTIYIGAGTFVENLYLAKNLSFIGAGMNQTILDGNGYVMNQRVITSATYSLSITDLTVQNGLEINGGGGGGIKVSDNTLDMLRVKVTNNTSTSTGGGISVWGGRLTITDSIISNNTVNDYNGAGYGGGLTVSNSGSTSATSMIRGTTISGNTAKICCGGIHIQGSTNLGLLNTTISGNTAATGGALINTGTASTLLQNVTIANNHINPPASPQYGIVNYATIAFTNTIVANNEEFNCANMIGGTWWSYGYNLDSGATCNFSAGGDLQNTDPLLDPLADYGGPTPTHALQAGSPAIDSVLGGSVPTEDQRGLPRLMDGNNDGIGYCDMGAFERKSNQTVTLYSIAAHDGHIIESGENTNAGGTLNSTSTTFNVGDESQDRQVRAILSFNTAPLPDNAVIKKVTLKIRKQSQLGTDPFTILRALKADIRKPSFGTGPAMVVSDFQATAGRLNVATFSSTPVNNWYSAVMSSLGYPHINLTGTTQFRLRFVTDDNNDNAADYMRFFSGNFTTASARPTLIIQYYVP